jgi:16S rRNA processing protein RimM
MVGNLILVGRFGAPHGVRGELRLYSFTGDPAAIASYKPLFDYTGTRQFSILRLRPVKGNMFIAWIAGVCDRASAGALTNATLFVPRASLPEAGDEEFYLADLIGLAVVTGASEDFGRVVNVLNFGSGDILEIAPQGGAGTLLLPFKKAVFPHVDLKAGRLMVVPPVEIEAQPSHPERQ